MTPVVVSAAPPPPPPVSLRRKTRPLLSQIPYRLHLGLPLLIGLLRVVHVPPLRALLGEVVCLGLGLELAGSESAPEYGKAIWGEEGGGERGRR